MIRTICDRCGQDITDEMKWSLRLQPDTDEPVEPNLWEYDHLCQKCAEIIAAIVNSKAATWEAKS